MAILKVLNDIVESLDKNNNNNIVLVFLLTYQRPLILWIMISLDGQGYQKVLFWGLLLILRVEPYR